MSVSSILTAVLLVAGIAVLVMAVYRWEKVEDDTNPPFTLSTPAFLVMMVVLLAVVVFVAFGCMNSHVAR